MNRMMIQNAKIITPLRIIPKGYIVIEEGRIMEIAEGDGSCEACQCIDAKGLYASPGFIDLHTHGGGGCDFMDGTAEAFIKGAEEHARHGTTALLATTLTTTNEELKNTFQVFREAKRQNHRGAALLGIHLEGPYFSMEQKGAQDARFIRQPRREEYEEILSWSDDILRWSAAPELEGALEFGRCIKAQGILPSIGHSDAVYEEVLEAFENGFTHITHLYSCTSGVRRIQARRYAGVIESAYLLDGMTVEIIADGVHLPSSLLKLIYKIKGADRVALVTDSMRAAGMPEGESILGSLKNGQKVMVEEGVAKLMDRSAFAGSVATADRLIRTMMQMAEVPLNQAVKMMTSTPASIIGVDHRKGSLTPGKDADVVLFNESIQIQMTMLEGKVVYNRMGGE